MYTVQFANGNTSIWVDTQVDAENMAEQFEAQMRGLGVVGAQSLSVIEGDSSDPKTYKAVKKIAIDPTTEPSTPVVDTAKVDATVKSATTKLKKLGLTEDEIAVLTGR